MKLRTLYGYDTSGQIMGTILGFCVLALAILAVGGMCFILSQIPIKCLLIGLVVLPIATLIAWDVGFRIMCHPQTWECGCGFSCEHPLKEWWHKYKCLSHIMNGRD